jgi:isoleucyl-tRNA synthetase
VVLTGRAPYRKVLTYEKLLDAEGREMHGSWGNQISADEAFERMGADVMRWLYCQQPPTQNIRFGFGPADDVKRRLLTLWNSARFLADYAHIENFEPRYEDLTEGVADVELRPLDRWLQSRTQQLIAEAEEAYDAYLSVEVLKAFESFIDDLSNWYIRRSRRRFYDYDEAAFRSLWTALVQSLRVVAPVMPMLADHLWRVLVADVVDGAPDSIHLAGWPTALSHLRDDRLLRETAAVREVVQLGRRARAKSGVKLRQPLRLLYVRGAPDARTHAEEIAEELRVKDVQFDAGPITTTRMLPNLRLLGPRLGPRLREVRPLLEAGEVERLEDGGFRVAGEVLSPEEVIQGERHELPGWATAEDNGISVAFDVELDDELRTEGRVLDLIHAVNALRKSSGIEITDRVALTLPESQADLLAHADWIAREVLATDVDVDGDLDEPAIEKVEAAERA